MTNPIETKRDADEASRRQKQGLPAEKSEERTARYVANPLTTIPMPARLTGEKDTDYAKRTGLPVRKVGESVADYSIRLGRSPAPEIRETSDSVAETQRRERGNFDEGGAGKPNLTNRTDQTS